MSGEIKVWPLQGRPGRPLPAKVMRPCDHGLAVAIASLETQLGSVEAYNRLADAAAALKAKIDAGNATAQNAIYAVHPKGAR